MMQRLLDAIACRFQGGSLEFALPDGRRFTLGAGEPRARLRFRSAAALRRVLMAPSLRLGESYMDGDWQPEGLDLKGLLGIGVRLEAHREHQTALGRWARLRSLLGEVNTPLSARRHVAHHYDLDESFYRRFLDADLHYSCAYFREPRQTLEEAQQEKCALIARKLDLRPGMSVLDIGCGWGGLAMHLAEQHGVHVTGVTLSEGQLRAAQRRASERGLAGSVEFRLQDYRDTPGQFDAVVSVGMFEHVGRPQYRRFFERVAELLRPEGVALLHTIGRECCPGGTNPWIRKYIFPGGYIPAASETLAAVECSGLWLTDLEVWRLHYARTLEEWHRRFQARREQVRQQFDERFCRMWEFYLQASEASFREGDLVVFHLQLARDRRRLPLTREYLYR
jgi:cyclopropane-fatty-acyl-phospholipid synthase